MIVLPDGVGVDVGVLVGVNVGVAVGVCVGVAVGVLVGIVVGVFVGVAVGVPAGADVVGTTINTHKLGQLVGGVSDMPNGVATLSVAPFNVIDTVDDVEL